MEFCHLIAVTFLVPLRYFLDTYYVSTYITDKSMTYKLGASRRRFIADDGVGNPAVRDFYLQSHGGFLGSEFINVSHFFSHPLIVLYS